jgi:chromosome segregation ATPase
MEPNSTPRINALAQRNQDEQQIIAKLQQRAEAQAYELQEQARRIQRFEEQLVETQFKLSSTPQLDDQLLVLKSELLQIVKEQYSRRQQNFRDVNNAMLAQLDGFAKTLHELRRDFDRMHRYDEQISLTRAELDRLNKEVNSFESQLNKVGKQLEERNRAATYLEDQRRADANHLAELQAEMPNLHKKIVTSLTKVQLVEQQSPQFARYQAALDEVREEIRRHREHMDFQMAQRERLMRNWSDSAESIERKMDDYKSLMDKYAEHYQLNKRALESLQDFQERLQREQHKAAELQRLAEDRQQSEMEKWRAEYEQRWKKQSMEWKPTFADVQKNMDVLQKRVDEMVKLSQTVNKQMDFILQIIEEDIQARTVSAQDWQQRFEELANGSS